MNLVPALLGHKEHTGQKFQPSPFQLILHFFLQVLIHADPRVQLPGCMLDEICKGVHGRRAPLTVHDHLPAPHDLLLLPPERLPASPAGNGAPEIALFLQFPLQFHIQFCPVLLGGSHDLVDHLSCPVSAFSQTQALPLTSPAHLLRDSGEALSSISFPCQRPAALFQAQKGLREMLQRAREFVPSGSRRD